MRDFYSRSYQLYFVYGSDMYVEQITSRCLNPEFFAVARLSDHRMAFFGHSKIWDGGEECLIRAPGEEAWGVIFKLSFSDADRLDAWQDVRLDGCGAHFLYPDDVVDTHGNSYPVLLMKRNFLGEPAAPTEEYLQHIIAGAAFHALPATYISALKRIKTKKASFPVPKQSTFDRALLANLSCDCGEV